MSENPVLASDEAWDGSGAVQAAMTPAHPAAQLGPRGASIAAEAHTGGPTSTHTAAADPIPRQGKAESGVKGVRRRRGGGGGDGGDGGDLDGGLPLRSRRGRRVKKPSLYESTSNEEVLQLKVAMKKSLQQQAVKPVDVPLAPVFQPTEEEWENPGAYLSKLHDVAAMYGVCKVVPPKGWTPPAGMFAKKPAAFSARFSTKRQQIDKLLEGKPYGEGNKYTTSEYQRMADKFKAERYPQFVPENYAKSKGLPHAWAHGSSRHAEGVVPSQEIKSGTGLASEPGFVVEERAEGADGGSAEKVKVRKLSPVGRGFGLVQDCIEFCALPTRHADKLADQVEIEYWRIVETSYKEVVIDYGNDIDSRKLVSGFPHPPKDMKKLRTLKPNLGDADYYIQSPWNLHNIARSTLLRYIPSRVTGVTSPWVYHGMLFASFAWHNEDTHLPSINYNHYGAAKTWYGVPGEDAEAFETCMREQVHVRFKEDPDLLQHITTVISPTVLQNAGIRVFKVVQRPGEFVCTFPRAYHSGFSHGFNCAEAVNFATQRWIPFGRKCSEAYRKLPRSSPISTDLLLTKLARHTKHLDATALASLLADLVAIRDEEVNNRMMLQHAGVEVSVHLNDDSDSRLDCAVCEHTCYLSALVCNCSPKKATCLRHFRDLCGCPMKERCFVYWHSVDAIAALCRLVAARLPSGSDAKLQRAAMVGAQSVVDAQKRHKGPATNATAGEKPAKIRRVDIGVPAVAAGGPVAAAIDVRATSIDDGRHCSSCGNALHVPGFGDAVPCSTCHRPTHTRCATAVGMLLKCSICASNT